MKEAGHSTGWVSKMLDMQMHIFKTVVEKKSFSLAAQELHMAQSSVSQQVQNLERHYGVKLFDRIHRRISLTEAGRKLYPYAVKLERLYQEAGKSMSVLTENIDGRLHIGASMTIGEYLMPEMLVSFSRMYPQVEIAMDIANTEEVTAMAVAGTINVGFVEGPFEKSGVLRCQPFYGDELVIIAPESYLAACDGCLSLSGILSERWVMREPNSGTRRVFEQFIHSLGYDISMLKVVMELGSTQAVKEAVKAGLGIAAVSGLAVVEEIKRQQVNVISLAEGPIERGFAMLYNKEKFQTRAVDKFITSFVEKVRLAPPRSVSARRKSICSMTELAPE